MPIRGVVNVTVDGYTLTVTLNSEEEEQSEKKRPAPLARTSFLSKSFDGRLANTKSDDERHGHSSGNGSPYGVVSSFVDKSKTVWRQITDSLYACMGWSEPVTTTVSRRRSAVRGMASYQTSGRDVNGGTALRYLVQDQGVVTFSFR
jgi:hypothetical protein